MQKVIDLRGGLKGLLEGTPYLVPTLVIYVLYASSHAHHCPDDRLTISSIIILANTCSPSVDQIELDANPERIQDDITKLCSLIFPYTLCPPTLFLEVLHINHLRHKASTSIICNIDPNHVIEAHITLSRIESFVPEDWAQPGMFYDEWLTIGTIYQAAIAIYCTMSFQSLYILPNSVETCTMRSAHGDRLISCLRKAMQLPRLVKFVAWPLVVAGVEAGYRGEATRNWVEAMLIDMSRVLGTSSPLKARAVLRQYWQKEERGWDECFDRP